VQALILGIGNVLWADEGFGVRAVETFNERYRCPDNISVMDGGTRGMALLPFVQDCDLLVIFDAVDFGLEPGTLRILRDSEVPAFLGAKKMSLHQTGFQEVLALAELTGEMPAHLLLIGVQPELIEDYGGGLTNAVAARIEPAIAAAVGYLAEHDIFIAQRLDVAEALSALALQRPLYEGERPSAEIACRIGDERFFPADMFAERGR